MIDVDNTNGAGVRIDLRPGMAWVLYSDDGPAGPCAQSVRAMSPKTVLFTFPDEETMRAAMAEKEVRGKLSRLMWGVVDEYTSGGVFRVIQST